MVTAGMLLQWEGALQMAPRSPASCMFVPSVELAVCTGYPRQRAKVEVERYPATLGIPLSLWNSLWNPALPLES